MYVLYVFAYKYLHEYIQELYYTTYIAGQATMLPEMKVNPHGISKNLNGKSQIVSLIHKGIYEYCKFNLVCFNRYNISKWNIFQSISIAIQRGNSVCVMGCPKEQSTGLEGLFNFQVHKAEEL